MEFDHGTWWLRFARACLAEGDDGDCDPPGTRGRKWITVRDDLSEKRELEVLLHETAHAADFRASEEAITEQARVQTELLWRLGWRKT